MNWVLVPQQIVTGILNGGTIGLIALGIVLIYKSSEVFNFAHGHMVMLGAFLTWWFAGGADNSLVDLPLLPAPATGVIPAVAGLTTNTPAAAPVGLPPGMPVMPPQNGMRRPPQSN